MFQCLTFKTDCVLLFQVLRRDLVNAIRKKRPNMDFERVNFHRAEYTQLELSLLGFDVLEHPPYSPDLLLWISVFFPELKSSLRGLRFDSTEEFAKQSQLTVLMG